jgi:hypothetical protein
MYISGADEGGNDVELLSESLSPSVWVLTSLGGVVLIGIALMIYSRLRGQEFVGVVHRIEKFPYRDALLLIVVVGTLDIAACSFIRNPTAGGILLVHGIAGTVALLWLGIHRMSRHAQRKKRFGLYYRLIFFFLVRPLRLGLFISCIILGFGILYGFSGFTDPFICVNQPDSLVHGSACSVSFKTHGLAIFGHAVYASVATFTTMGYADIKPSGSLLTLFASAVEAVLGFFFFSLLVAVLAARSARAGYMKDLEKYFGERKMRE